MDVYKGFTGAAWNKNFGYALRGIKKIATLPIYNKAYNPGYSGYNPTYNVFISGLIGFTFAVSCCLRLSKDISA